MNSIIKNLKVYKLWHGWIWIASLSDWKKVLIKWWALPGSTVDVTVVKNRKDHIEAHILETKKYDPAFSDGEIFCPHFFIPKWISEQNTWTAKIWCGWCKWQMMSYQKQLEIKQQLIEDAFKKINKNLIDDNKSEIKVLPIIASPLQQWYRNKIEFSFWVYKQQNPEFRKLIKSGESEENILKNWIKKYDIDCNQCCWFHKQWEFAKIVDVDGCGLISKKMNQVFETIKNLCFNSWLPVFDQKTHQWFFRHLVIREWVHTEQLMVNLSISFANLNEDQTKLWEQLMEDLKNNEFLKKNVTTFVITYNEWLSDTVKNELSESKVFRGDWYIHEQLNFTWNEKNNSEYTNNNETDDIYHELNETKLTFRISPFSFFQTNTLWAEKLFWTAFSMLWNVEWNFLDLYCGAGSIWLSLLKQNQSKNKDSELIWVEIVEDAIHDANVNASINWLENQSFFVASPCEKVLNKFPELEEKIKNLGVVIVDPPREWLHPNVISRIWNLKKNYRFKLLYISCNPITMARDIELFIKEQGFITREVQPVDMFPHTHHIENISVLE